MASMKVFLVALVVILSVFSSAIGASAADAKTTDKVVQISRVSAYPSGSDVLVSVNLKTGRKLTDAKITVSVPELGIRAGNKVDFSKKKKQTVRVQLAVPAEFDPYLRIVFSSDEGRRIKFRPFVVQ